MSNGKVHIHCDACDLDIKKSDWDTNLDSEKHRIYLNSFLNIQKLKITNRN
jgi:hypothetical protein